MAKEDQIVAALGAVKSSMRHINRRSMRLGRYIGGVLEERVNNDLPANYVWVFDPQGDKRVSSPAKNLKTEYGKGLAVIVAFNVDTLEDDVIDVDTVLAPLEQGSAAAGLNSPQKPASLSTPVSARDITVGGVFADSGGGLNVRIGAFWHENGYYTDSTALTLTPTATSGKKSLAMVGVNRLTNAAASTLTADRSTATTLIANGVPTSYAVTDIMAVVDANPHIDWRGAVELKHGDTEVNPAKIIPLNWLKPSMVGADGSTAGERGLVPAPAAADNVKALFGDGDFYSVMKTDGTIAMSGDLNLNGNDLNNAATLLLNEGSAPSTPASGKVVVYAKTDGLMYSKDDAGAETPLGGGGGGGANTALSNLSSVAINTSLVSDTDSTDDLGSTSAYWRNGYIDTLYLTEQSAPSTPATDKGVLYPKTDGKLYWLNDTGTEYDLTSTASGGALATVQAWTELGSNAASLSKTSISGSYDYLEIILNLRTDRAGQKLDDVIVSLNSDTTAGNYRSTGHYITGANATGVQTYRGVTVGGFAVYFGANGAGATSNYFAAITLRIYNYASTVPYKTMRYDGYVDGSGALDSDIGILNGGGVWLSTSAITSVTVAPRYGSNFVTGSAWAIYAR